MSGSKWPASWLQPPSALTGGVVISQRQGIDTVSVSLRARSVLGFGSGYVTLTIFALGCYENEFSSPEQTRPATLAEHKCPGYEGIKSPWINNHKDIFIHTIRVGCIQSQLEASSVNTLHWCPNQPGPTVGVFYGSFYRRWGPRSAQHIFSGNKKQTKMICLRAS